MVTRQLWRSWRVIALMALLLALLAGTTGETFAAGSCTATYKLVAQWSGSFLAEVTVKNTGTSPTNGWTVNWTFPNGQTIDSMTSSRFTQVGANVTVTNQVWNAVIQPGGIQGGGVYVQGSWRVVNNPPTDIRCSAS